MSAQVYFFNAGRYVRYDVLNDAVDAGYPLSTGDQWPGMRRTGFDTGLDSALDLGGGSVYFLKASKYVRYDIVADTVPEGYLRDIGDNWPGMREAGFASGIDAAVNWGDGKAYVFKGSKYVRYDIAEDKVDDGYPLDIGDNWPGLRAAGFADGLDTAVNWGNGKIFFFKGSRYVRYDMTDDRVDDGYPLDIGTHWPGMSAAGFGSGVTAATPLIGVGRPTPLTGDLSEEFFRLIRQAGTALRCHPAKLLIVLNSESGVRANALHPSGVAAGINQFVDATLRGLGWTRGCAAFAQLDAAAQVPYVQRYFTPHIHLDLDSIGRIYQLNFLPATARPGQGAETVLAQHGGVNGQAYDDNKILDSDADGTITIGDLEIVALRQRNKPRWKEIESRL